MLVEREACIVNKAKQKHTSRMLLKENIENIFQKQ